MSHFSDFDDFLNREEEERNKHQTQHTKAVLQSRKDLDPVIREILELFKEYFETILLPRKPLVMILKKSEVFQKDLEEPNGKWKTGNGKSSYYLYRINLIDKDMLLPVFDATAVVDAGFFQSNKITKHDWHAYVALQFDLELVDTKNYQGEYSGNLQPEVAIRIWGRVKEDKSMPFPASVKLSYQPDGKLTFAQLTIKQDQTINEFVQTIKHVLMLITPQVFQHEEEVWNIKT